MAYRRLWLWLIAASIPLGLMAGFVGIGGAVGEDARATSGLYGVPQDYREIIARHILTKTDREKVHRAEITGPGLSYGYGSPPRPTVCASMSYKSSRLQPDHVVGFTFEDGKIDEIFNPDDRDLKIGGGAWAAVIKYAHTCDTFSYVPFPEVSKTAR